MSRLSGILSASVLGAAAAAAQADVTVGGRSFADNASTPLPTRSRFLPSAICSGTA